MHHEKEVSLLPHIVTTQVTASEISIVSIIHELFYTYTYKGIYMYKWSYIIINNIEIPYSV